jgi:hypothetical protein
MNDRNQSDPRRYDILRKIHPRNMTPFERFLMRLTDWSERGSVAPLKPELESPKSSWKPKIPWNRPKR